MENIKISKSDLEILHDNKDLVDSSTYISDFNLEILNDSTELYATSVYTSNFSIEILHKGEYIEYEETDNTLGFFAGIVFDKELPVRRKLFAFDSITKLLVGSCISNNDGNFLLHTTISGSCYIVCASEDLVYNHLVAASVIPALI